MKKKFSIIDLLDIFYEKIIYFIILFLISIVLAWFINSKIVPKYNLKIKVLYLDSINQKSLMELSSLEFYENYNKYYNNDYPLITFNKKETINDFILKWRFGSLYSIVRKLETNYTSNELEVKLKEDKILKYVYDNIKYNYLPQLRYLIIDLPFSSRENLELYKESFLDFVEYLHEETKQEFVLNLQTVNENSIRILDNHKYFVKELQKDFKKYFTNQQLNKNQSYEYLINVEIYLDNYIHILDKNKIIIDDIIKNLDFNVTGFINDNSTVRVESLHIKYQVVYATVLTLFILLYITILLIILGYRNR